MTLNIEIQTIPDCPHAAQSEALVRDALRDIHAQGATIRTTIILTPDDAAAHGFIGSPTILVNGVDPFAPADPVPAFACRVYGSGGLPDIRDLRQALKRAAHAAQSN